MWGFRGADSAKSISKSWKTPWQFGHSLWLPHKESLRRICECERAILHAQRKGGLTPSICCLSPAVTTSAEHSLEGQAARSGQTLRPFITGHFIPTSAAVLSPASPTLWSGTSSGSLPTPFHPKPSCCPPGPCAGRGDEQQIIKAFHLPSAPQLQVYQTPCKSPEIQKSSSKTGTKGLLWFAAFPLPLCLPYDQQDWC